MKLALNFVIRLINKIQTIWRQKFNQFSVKHSYSGKTYDGTVYLAQHIFNLHSIDIQKTATEIKLVSFPFGEGGSSENPQLAAFTFEKNTGYHYVNNYVSDIELAVQQNRSKPVAVIETSVFLLPFSTTHFGHFTGECLGAIIAYSRLVSESNRKLFYLCPPTFQSLIEKYGQIQNLERIQSSFAFENNLIFKNAKVLPRLSPWQNLSLCNEIFAPILEQNLEKYDRVFLTSQRTDRIRNIQEVTALLAELGFCILNPLERSFEETVGILARAKHVVSENGSIIHNALMLRTRATYVLASHGYAHVNGGQFAGGGVFNAFRVLSIIYVECEAVLDTNHGHPYSQQLLVDLQALKNLINGWA